MPFPKSCKMSLDQLRDEYQKASHYGDTELKLFRFAFLMAAFLDSNYPASNFRRYLEEL